MSAHLEILVSVDSKKGLQLRDRVNGSQPIDRGRQAFFGISTEQCFSEMRPDWTVAWTLESGGSLAIEFQEEVAISSHSVGSVSPFAASVIHAGDTVRATPDVVDACLRHSVAVAFRYIVIVDGVAIDPVIVIDPAKTPED